MVPLGKKSLSMIIFVEFVSYVVKVTSTFFSWYEKMYIYHMLVYSYSFGVKKFPNWALLAALSC